MFPFSCSFIFGNETEVHDDLFKLEPSLFQALVSWSKDLTVRIISDRRLFWAAINSAINSSLSTCFLLLATFPKVFPPVCASIDWALHFWFSQSFCYRLLRVSFCFRSALHFLSVASLEVISLQWFCESCPRLDLSPIAYRFPCWFFVLRLEQGVGAAVLVVEGVRVEVLFCHLKSHFHLFLNFF